MAIKKGEECHCGHSHKGKGAMALIVGLLVFANIYWMNFSWAQFVGGLLVLAGIIKLAIPNK